MAMIQATYANNSASVFQARFDRYLNDVLAAPMRPWEVNLALSIGGVVRALLIGAGLFVCALAVVDVPVHHPLELVARRGAGARALLFVRGDRRDLRELLGPHGLRDEHRHPAPDLPGRRLLLGRSPARAVARRSATPNPIFYLLNAVRYGFLGTSDVSVLLSLGVTGALAAAMVAWSSWLFRTGHRLKP